MGHRALVTVWLIVLMVGSGGVWAAVYRGPGGAFSVQLEGAWSVQTPEPGCLLLLPQPQRPEVTAVIFTPAEVDPCKPVAEQLVRLIEADAESFPNPRGFTAMETQVLGQACEGLSVTFDGPDGQSMLAVGTVFPAGNTWHLGAVIGPLSQELMGFAWQVFAGIVPPRSVLLTLSADPSRGGKARTSTALPAGWLLRATADKHAMQVLQDPQPGAMGELCLLPAEGRGARGILSEAFYEPLRHKITVDKVTADEGDTMAQMTYHRTVNGLALQGEALVAVAGADALFAHVCGPTASYASATAKVKRLLDKLATGTAAPAPSAAPPASLDPAKLSMKPQYNDDHSAVVSVPKGWTVRGSGGTVVAQGPQGYVVIGLAVTVIDPQTAMLPAGAPPPPRGVYMLPYMPPARALPEVMAQGEAQNGGALSNVRLLDARDIGKGPNWAAVDLAWTQRSAERNWGALRVAGVVGTVPGIGSWLLLATFCAAPENQFSAADKLMATIIGSRKLLGRSRLSARGASGRLADINADASGLDIIDQVIRNRNESQDINARKWSAYMRDEEALIDPSSGSSRLVGSASDLNRWVEDDPSLRLDNLRPMTMDEWHTNPPE